MDNNNDGNNKWAKGIGSFIGIIAFVVVIFIKFPKILETLKELISETKEKGTSTSATKDTAPVSKTPSFSLSGRQEEIYQSIKENGQLGMSDIAKRINGVSTRTLRRDMIKLENLGLVRHIGKTKDSIYKLKE